MVSIISAISRQIWKLGSLLVSEVSMYILIYFWAGDKILANNSSELMLNYDYVSRA